MDKKVVLFSLVLISILGTFKLERNAERLIWSDMEGYYTYLPSVLIYGEFSRAAVKDTAYLKTFAGTDQTYTKYTCGVAIMELPFFLAAHAYSHAMGLPTDGKTATYGRGIMLGGLFYFWMAMLVLYRYGRRYASKGTVWIALGCIALGTNLFYYTFYQPGMSHVYSFFLFSVFLAMTDTIFVSKDQQWCTSFKVWALYGLVFGMIVLTRPTNAILAILPIYIWIKSENNLIAYLRSHWQLILLGAVCFLLPFIPQLMYWHYISGDWVIWSYGDENFRYWKEPKLIRVLFDPWNGWILYSPIVLFPLIVLVLNRNHNRHYERGTLLVLAIATYIFASWWAWWFGGAFGHRSFVEFGVLLVLPFIMGINYLADKPILKPIILVLFVMLCYYNIGLTLAYSPPWDGDSWTYTSWWDEVQKVFFVK